LSFLTWAYILYLESEKITEPSGTLLLKKIAKIRYFDDIRFFLEIIYSYKSHC